MPACVQENEGDADRTAFQSIDWHDFVVVETIDFDENEELPAPAAGPDAVDTGADDDDDMDMDMDMSESDQEEAQPVSVPADSGIKIRSDYVPQVEVEKKKAVTHFIDPKTGKAVPIEEASDHMRIGACTAMQLWAAHGCAADFTLPTQSSWTRSTCSSKRGAWRNSARQAMRRMKRSVPTCGASRSAARTSSAVTRRPRRRKSRPP